MTNDRALTRGDDAAWPQDYPSFVIERAARRVMRLQPRSLRSHQPLEGRFIWQLVGVLDTYGSICLIGAKV